MLTKLDFITRVVSKSRPHLTLVSGFAAPAAQAKTTAQTVGKKRFRLPVETDLEKLMTHCCGANYFKTGEEVKLKDDSEYPEWLWKLPLKPKRLHEYDPSTKEYWEKHEEVGRQRENKLRTLAPKRTLLVNKQMIADQEYKYRNRFRALAKYHYDAGLEALEHQEMPMNHENWSEKERYRLPMEKDKPFYPGIDKVNLPYQVQNMPLFRKNVKKVDHFGH